MTTAVNDRRPKSFHFLFRHLEVNGEMYESVLWTHIANEQKLPNLLMPYDVSPLSEYYEPFHFAQLDWMRNSHPHLAFLPCDFVFQGPIFQRLGYDDVQLPIVNTKEGWKLEEGLAEKWRSLKAGLAFTANVFFEKGLYPIEFNTRRPSTYGYLRPHSSETFARRCACKSRDSFRELLGLCMMGMALQRDWQATLSKRSKEFCQPWLDNLQDAILHLQPRGAICDLSECSWSPRLRTLQKKAPIWFLGAILQNDGTVEYKRPEEPTRHLFLDRPTDSDLSRFLKAAKEVVNAAPVYNYEWGPTYSIDGIYDASTGFVFTKIHPSLITTPTQSLDICENISSPGHENFPAPFTGSGQRLGESVYEFLRRGEEDNAAMMEFDNNHQQMLHENRRVKALIGHPPALDVGEASVWEWIPVGGVLLRSRVLPGYVVEQWGLYSEQERRFDSFSNQWDLCRELVTSDPTIQVNPNVSTNDDDGAITVLLNNALDFTDETAEARYTEDDPGITNICDMMERNIRNALLPDIQPIHATSDNLSAYEGIHHRYGFTIDNYDSNNGSISGEAALKVKSIFGYGNCDTLSKVDLALVVFAEALSSYPTTKIQPIPALWDISQTNSRYIGKRVSNIRYESTQMNAITPTGRPARLDLYFLKSRNVHNIKTNFTIATPSSATVMQAMRKSWGQ
ncbi:hypothetical protein BDN72DRAFT_903761 [Pluteus cervinus]|uniref:Uncharacterized protein n=1 Tax=Pluteus cervinus TaxID=181527 RepID=A0ACD3A7Z7_9AGAR|nr:hypothetical protein BDN72DRAFT_903761 [Pluteus cervinus]